MTNWFVYVTRHQKCNMLERAGALFKCRPLMQVSQKYYRFEMNVWRHLFRHRPLNHSEPQCELLLNFSPQTIFNYLNATVCDKVTKSGQIVDQTMQRRRSTWGKVKGQTSKRPTNPRDEKDGDFRMPPKNPLGDVCAFLTCQSDAAIRLRVWPWLPQRRPHLLPLGCPAPAVREPHSSPTRFSPFSVGDVWKHHLVLGFFCFFCQGLLSRWSVCWITDSSVWNNSRRWTTQDVARWRFCGGEEIPDSFTKCDVSCALLCFPYFHLLLHLVKSSITHITYYMLLSNIVMWLYHPLEKPTRQRSVLFLHRQQSGIANIGMDRSMERWMDG